MSAKPGRHSRQSEKIALVLQGGGALGAYQAGAYEALCDGGLEPEWVAGVSIGAINGAIIAGNKPADRVPQLRRFWEKVSGGAQGANPLAGLVSGGIGRTLYNEASAALAATFGIPGFYQPRLPPPVFQLPGTDEALSWYDTQPLRETLEDVVDFGLLNKAGPRLSVGAVNVTTGNNIYFDTGDAELGPAHIMASGALPPGFAPVEIDGKAYWDGGLVSNTPLRHVLDVDEGRHDLCVFQVDLFSARGAMPEDLLDVEQRTKDIRYSSRTRLNTDLYQRLQELREAGRQLYDKLPADLKKLPAAQRMLAEACEGAVTIVHLIYRHPDWVSHHKDYEFSRLTIEEHWRAGREDVEKTLAHDAWRNRTMPEAGVAVLDLTKQEPAADADGKDSK